MRLAPAFVALLAFPLAPAAAQEPPPQGIGFAQAEEGTWLCRHDDPASALSCARELCIEQASGQECWETAWCYPANWSGLMTIWLPDFHTTHVLCGAPSQASLTQALAAICSGDAGAVSCDVTRIIDPQGNEIRPEGVTFVGPAARGTGALVPEQAAPESAAPATGGAAAESETPDSSPGGG